MNERENLVARQQITLLFGLEVYQNTRATTSSYSFLRKIVIKFHSDWSPLKYCYFLEPPLKILSLRFICCNCPETYLVKKQTRFPPSV